jgi:hypothetical protein
LKNSNRQLKTAEFRLKERKERNATKLSVWEEETFSEKAEEEAA